jgi:histone H3
MNGTQVGILKEPDKVSLSSLLESQDSRSLEAKVTLEILGNFTNQTLERELSDQQVGRLLVSADFTKRYGTWAVTVGLLDSSGGWGGLSGSLGCELFTRSFSSSRLTSGLVGRVKDRCERRASNDNVATFVFATNMLGCIEGVAGRWQKPSRQTSALILLTCLVRAMLFSFVGTFVQCLYLETMRGR